MSREPVARDLCLAIHHRPDSFSERWIERCRELGIAHRVVDGYGSDVMTHLDGCQAFLWHFDHEDATDLLVARSVLSAARYAGLRVFPDWATSWHFDDKIAQKYLLEAVEAPLVGTHVFYDKGHALAWLQTTRFPLVAKLRAGAGSAGVRLLRDFGSARRYCYQMFGAGVQPVAAYFTDSATKVRSIQSADQLVAKLRRLPGRVMRRYWLRRRKARERGYVLFQEFVPANTFDTRVVVIGDRAWGFIRHVRKNDFRASGSRNIEYDPAMVNEECVRIAFRVARALRSQSMAFDFVATPDGAPQLVEISYGYASLPVRTVPGQWSPDLTWHAGHAWAEDAILDDLLGELTRARAGDAPSLPGAGARLAHDVDR